MSDVPVRGVSGCSASDSHIWLLKLFVLLDAMKSNAGSNGKTLSSSNDLV
jgi:hypothetical protein